MLKSSKLLRTAAALLCCACCFCACSRTASDDPAAVTTAMQPEETEQTSPIEEPVSDSFPFTFFLDDGSEYTVTLPRDPEYWAELHSCTLDDSGDATPVILLTTENGTGVHLEQARAFSCADGTEYPVTPVDEILTRYVTAEDCGTHWLLTVNGAGYEISKEQFADYPPEELFPVPNLSATQNFYVEHGRLYCRVGLLCAGAGTGYAAESLVIRYGLTDGTVTANEITFDRPTAQETEETP